MKCLPAVALLMFTSLPLHGLADSVQAVTCSGAHFVRAGGTELRSTGIVFRNADVANAVTIERLTIRSAYGQVIHDSGPAIGVPHPVNPDFSVDLAGGLDITVVPPGANYFLGTTHIWGVNNIPGGLSQGFLLAVTVEASKAGRPELFAVETRVRSRELVAGPAGLVERAERSSDSGSCTSVKPTAG